MAEGKEHSKNASKLEKDSERRKNNERRKSAERRTKAERRNGQDRRIAPKSKNDNISTQVEDEGRAVKVELPSQTDYISLVRQFVGGVAKKAGFNDLDIEKIELAIDEACSNVLQHAYKFASNNRYAIEIAIANSKLNIIITDQGDSFTFNGEVVPDIEKHVSELKIGGLGIFIMQQMMDEVNYESLPECGNVLRMVKYIKTDKE